MIISWFENLILLISGILGGAEDETVDVWPVELVSEAAGRLGSVFISRGASGGRRVLARGFLWPSVRE